MRDHSGKLLQARALAQTGQLDQAKSVLMRALQKGVGDAVAPMCQLLSQLLLQTGQKEQALHYAERAAASSPKDPDLLIHQSAVLWSLGRPSDALAAARRALEVAPASRNAHGNLINLYMREERFAQALAIAERALQKFAGDPEFLAIQASMLLGVGRTDAAVAGLRSALEREPTNLRLLGALAPALNYAPDIDPAEILGVHVAYANALRAAMPRTTPPAWKRPDDPARPLRIGLLSPDFRRHAMYHYIYPIVAGLDRDKFQLHCYFTAANPDAATERLRAAATRAGGWGGGAGGGTVWNHVPTLNIAQLADKIRADRIDILIDLAGHTHINRLGTLMLRGAPVQMSMIGYPCTTGVAEVDYQVTDSKFCPPGTEPGYIERLLRLDPCFFCYHPSDEETPPAITPPPFEANGYVTFGSFNSLMKLNDRVVAAWARIMKAVPTARLLLKNVQLIQDEARGITTDRLIAAGIPAERLEVVGHRGTMNDHLNTYSKIDIALDTFPYAGMTTTCESLFMGVPVVTVPQRTFVSRAGFAMLTNVGLPDLIARDEEDFVTIAVNLANDTSRIRAIRSTLREKMLASVMCDSKGYAARLGGMLRESWREWCGRA